MDLSELDYELPPELIAQHPADRRDASRLLVYERETGAIRHRSFAGLPDELAADDLLVVNDTRVVPARIRGRRATGGDAEVLLLEPVGDREWEALARPSRRVRPGERIGAARLVRPLGDGRRAGRGGPAGRRPLARAPGRGPGRGAAAAAVHPRAAGRSRALSDRLRA